MRVLIGLGVVAAFILCWLAMPIAAGLLVYAHQRIVKWRRKQRRIETVRRSYAEPWDGGAL